MLLGTIFDADIFFFEVFLSCCYCPRTEIVVAVVVVVVVVVVLFPVIVIVIIINTIITTITIAITICASFCPFSSLPIDFKVPRYASFEMVSLVDRTMFREISAVSKQRIQPQNLFPQILTAFVRRHKWA